MFKGTAVIGSYIYNYKSADNQCGEVVSIKYIRSDDQIFDALDKHDYVFYIKSGKEYARGHAIGYSEEINRHCTSLLSSGKGKS